MFAPLLFIIALMRPNTAPRWSLGGGDTPVPSCWRATPAPGRGGATSTTRSRPWPPQGVVHARWAGNERRFAASRPRWTALLDVERPPAFVSWVHLLPALTALLTWLDDTAASDASDYLIASRARDFVERIGPEAAGVELPRTHAAHATTYLPAFEHLVAVLLAVLAQR